MEFLVSTDEYDDNTSIVFWNPNSGTKLLTFRGPAGNVNTLDAIRDEGFAVVEIGKPFIHFWQCGQSLQTSRRILCPGKPCALAVHPDGNYFAVAIEEKIHIWHAPNGRIVSSLSSAHFRPVTVLKFSANGKFLASGGSDGLVNAWNVVQLVGNQASCVATYTWSDHSLPVTGLHIGTGQKSSIYTCSLDRTCKIFSLLSGNLLLSVSFPVSLSSIAVDRNETAAYGGSKSGVIYQINLLSASRSVEQHVLSDAAADSTFKKKHTCQITALTITADGRNLASGDEGGNIYIWDVCSKQAIRTVHEVHTNISTSVAENSSTRGISRKISNLRFFFGCLENLKGTRKPIVCFPETPKLLDTQENTGSDSYVVKVWNRYENTFDIPSSNPADGGHSQLAEISKLKMELEKQEHINIRLKEFCIRHTLNQTNGVETNDDPRNRKKARMSKQ